MKYILIDNCVLLNMSTVKTKVNEVHGDWNSEGKWIYGEEHIMKIVAGNMDTFDKWFNRNYYHDEEKNTVDFHYMEMEYEMDTQLLEFENDKEALLWFKLN